MKLLVGLGNPGKEYIRTRHNVGFLYIDSLNSFFKLQPCYKRKFYSDISESDVKGEKIIFSTPQTFMNRSGESVLAIANFYKIKPNQIFVVHDDIDIALGKIKVKIGGGSGGHNGIKSIDSVIGKEYYRIRIGVGRPPQDYDVSSYVLEKFNQHDQEIIDQSVNS